MILSDFLSRQDPGDEDTDMASYLEDMIAL